MDVLEGECSEFGLAVLSETAGAGLHFGRGL